MVSTSWETQSDSRTLWKVFKEPCPVHQPQPDSYADFPPPPPSLLGDIFMTALSSSSASPPPVSPSPHDSPQAASTTTRKKNQPYRKKESLQGHKGSVCGTAEDARMSAEGGDQCRINYLNFIYFLHIHNIYNVFNIYFHICI